MNKVDKFDCFGSYETPNGRLSCNVLKTANCENCKFYRNDITRNDIEREIKSYYSTKGVKNEY